MKGRLYLVATPIGNLADMTHRSVQVLQEADFVLAEDTRTSRRILQHYRIDTPFYSSVYQGAERQRIPSILSMLRDGKQLALISDAGTPLISDPGFPLVRATIEAGYDVIPIPGACAAIAGLIASGLTVDRFTFEGALPRARGARRATLETLIPRNETSVFYESSHRIGDTLQQIAEVLPSRKLVLARELTKLHEEFLRGTATELLERLAEQDRVRGELVLVIEGTDVQEGATPSSVHRTIAALRDEGMANKSIVRILVDVLEVPRNEAYRFVHDPQQGNDPD
jgi:16S rRNA (cytidine1402-2'-O)-methyltransferase